MTYDQFSTIKNVYQSIWFPFGIKAWWIIYHETTLRMASISEVNETMSEAFEDDSSLSLRSCAETSAVLSPLLQLDVSWSLSSRGVGNTPSPVIAQHLSGLGVDDVDNDASVTPAFLEQVVVLVALSRVEGLVEESPWQLLGSVDLQSPSCPHTNVLTTKVAVFLITVIQPDNRELQWLSYILHFNTSWIWEERIT